jgi:hypothetical protein
MSYTVQDYRTALQKAQQANDADAVAYFKTKIDELSKPDYEQLVSQQKADRATSVIQSMGEQPVTMNPATWHRALPESGIAATVAVGRGLTEAGKGFANLIGIGDGKAVEDGGYSDLEEAYPVSSTVGNVVGQALPFLAGGMLSTGSKLANVGIQGLTGALEGASIASGTGQDVGQSAAIGGTIAGAVEAAFPIVGRIVSKFGAAKLIDEAGNPTPQFLAKLRENGVEPTPAILPYLADAVNKYGDTVSLPSAEKAARFESMGVPYSQGDVAVGQGGFDQQFYEDRLAKMTGMPEAEDFRRLKLDQSKAIAKQVEGLSDGTPELAAENIKEALKSRKVSLKDAQRTLYQDLRVAQEGLGMEAGNLTGIAMPEPRKVASIYQAVPDKVNSLNDVLVRFGINQDQNAVEAYAKKSANAPMGADLQIQPLSMENYEDFRQAIKGIERSDQTGAIKVLTGDILNNTEKLIDDRLGFLESVQGIGELAKQARAVTRQLKTEFSPESITGRLIAVKRDGVTPIIENSAVIRNLFSSGKEERSELLERTVASLANAGDKGKQAIADLQAAYAAKVLDDSLNAASRTIDGERVVSGEALQKGINKLSDKELGVLFQGDKKALEKIRALGKIAQDITPPAGARSQGASSTIINLVKSVSSRASSIPGGGIVSTVLENYASAVEKAATRQKAIAAGKKGPMFTPKEKKAIEYVGTYMPAIAAYGGISSLDDEEK